MNELFSLLSIVWSFLSSTVAAVNHETDTSTLLQIILTHETTCFLQILIPYLKRLLRIVQNIK